MEKQQLARWCSRMANTIEQQMQGPPEGGFVETLEVRYCIVCGRQRGSYDPCSLSCQMRAYREIALFLTEPTDAR